MPAVHLVPIDAALADALATGTFECDSGASLPDAPSARSAVDQMLAGFPDAAPPWCGYLAVDTEAGAVVGTCAFKGPPSDDGPVDDGTVEIAYWTFERFEGQGYAKAMARALLDVAAPERVRVVAHTLPEPNASTRVLQAVGFAFAGDVVDPEDGPVWRWALPDRPA